MFITNCQTDFQSVCTISYSHEQCMKALAAPHPAGRDLVEKFAAYNTIERVGM